MITASLLEDFTVSVFWSALLGSVVISIVTILLGAALKDGEKR
jgi:uncharacterized membrane protein YvlD (DUF360 family)